jgi:hypothetical protein
MIEHVVDRIFREWLKMALLNGMIPGITDRDVTRWTRVSGSRAGSTGSIRSRMRRAISSRSPPARTR